MLGSKLDEEEREGERPMEEERPLEEESRGDCVERGEELAEELDPGLVIVSQLAMLEAPGEGRALVKLAREALRL